jgi:hypothetical protein
MNYEVKNEPKTNPILANKTPIRTQFKPKRTQFKPKQSQFIPAKPEKTQFIAASPLPKPEQTRLQNVERLLALKPVILIIAGLE